jgi:formamidopyrimidine-DNA glycosylase
MPELPEVETIVRDLRARLIGRRISSVQKGRKALRRRWFRHWLPELIGKRVEDIGRRGKWIVVGLENHAQIGIHLGMTGQLTVVRAKEPLSPHTHLVFDLDRGRDQLRFRDVRRFGSVTLFPTRQNLERFFQESRLGPEPFDLDPDYWEERLAATARCLKAVLLDQQVLAGVGNIYADEALFEARLHPALIARQVSRRDADRLRRAIATVLRRAIDRRGSSIRDYLDGSGSKGGYQLEFRAYGRAGEACPRCRQRIQRIRLAGRATYFCPHCQSRVRNSKSEIR